MARALWELAWSLRYHPEAVARRGVLVALCAVAQALPAALLHELDLALPELQEWLRSCAEGELRRRLPTARRGVPLGLRRQDAQRARQPVAAGGLRL